MDYKSILLNILLSLGFLTFLTACGGPNEEITIGSLKTSPEPLSIIGNPPSSLYYDAQFEFEFGASGGDGNYRYRYIQNPIALNGDSINSSPNPVEMSIEILDSAKPAFKLKAQPEIPENINFEELTDQTYTYQIELTDGKNTVKREFEFNLKKNTLKLTNLPSATEGRVNTTAASNLLRQLNLGQTSVCDQITERTFEKGTNNKGETVFPIVFQVFTDVPVASRTELFYRLSSIYSSSEIERSDRNIGYLRPDVDYVDQVRSIILEPGESTCIGFIEMMDDTLIEGDEELRLEFFNRSGGAIDFNAAASSITLRDNELLPEYVTKNIVRNKGDKIVVPIKTLGTRDYPVSFLVSVDQANTTADDNDFILEPSNGVVTINPGELEASYTVTLLNTADNNIATVSNDKIITLKTDIDKVLDVDPYTIEINQWPLLNAIENEIVATEADNEEVIDFAVDNDGIVTTLITHNGGTDLKTRLKSFYRDATQYPMTEQNLSIDLGKVGLDIIPRALEFSSSGESARLIVVANVNGLYGDVFRGEMDFVVVTYSRNTDGFFTLDNVKQYGTEGDDIVRSAIIRNGILYVYGKTNGQNFEGLPSGETNNGGEDGFIYAINPQNNSRSWSRFIGTSDNDIVNSVDAGNRDVIALVSTVNSDQDAFVKKISARTSLDLEEDKKIEFKTPRDDIAVEIRFDATANNYRALLNSTSLLSETNTLTPSLSQDAQLIAFDADNASSGATSIATADEDEAISFENMPDKLNFVIAGNTFGQFESNQKKSEIGRDAFVSIFDAERQSAATLKKTIQFGTIEDDQVIKIRPVSNTKFLVLWKERFTSSPSATYRISPFSIDGRKLSIDPGQ